MLCLHHHHLWLTLAAPCLVFLPARQVEEMRDLGWRRLSFEEYVNFLNKKLQLYTSLAAAQGK